MRDDPSEAVPDGTAELHLEPVRFIARTDAVLRLGTLMLGAGASSARVRDTMDRTARALGLERLESRVGMTDIVITAQRGQLFRTRVAEVRHPVVNSERIAEVMHLSHRVADGVAPDELQRELDRIERMPPRYPTAVRVAAAAAACTAFAFLNNGGWAECLSVALAVALGQYVRIRGARLQVNEFLLVFLSASTALLTFLGVSHLIELLGAPSPQYGAALTSAVLYLVPGFPLVTGALDLARLDLNAGVNRVVYAGLVLLSTGCAVWAVAAIFQTSAVAVAAPALGEPLLSLGRLIAGFVGVMGFALLFSTPWRTALAAAAIGTVANVGRLLMIDHGAMQPVAAAAAGVAVGFGAFAVSRFVRSPRITLTVPAVLIMVPGASAYRAIVGTIEGDTISAVQYGVTAVFVVVALAVGLTVARVVTEREWQRPSAR
ncbi:threonine/serine ThrE exporter family protein [Microbacterium imperiale]|uniref:Threonine/serine exporter family protein n=1 Tax=Microbacterium imperiale TaxID=33884 RepID=A0A9W6M321_9MICO|nr:threonine/serine exporter family protein [Microbacterium imperiale]MBP2420385.1 uncharacterized membrane protein YjjP (DUF1212 family) [Microbacterium imperiale]MDS0197757.1 threonine/serine exporter family protein [Microbacterium imperiale]BFE40727.1 threonine/serine exporter family protein [Microbacterium imperiale]GLJ80128.1 hypothetical protein GCM10017586_18110 [Microbacterium imperiale]